MEYYFIAQSRNYHLNDIFRKIKSKSVEENHHREPVVSGSPILILTFICCTITVKGYVAATMVHDKI